MRALIVLLAVRHSPVIAYRHYRFFAPQFLFTKSRELSDFRCTKLKIKPKYYF